MNTSPRWGGVSRRGAYSFPEKQASQHSGFRADCRSPEQNNAGTRIEHACKIGAVCSTDVPHPPNENPGALEHAPGLDEGEFKPEENPTLVLAARHPILAVHWGIAG